MRRYLFGICIVICCVLAGCVKETEPEKEYPVLKLMTMGTEPGKMDEIYRELDELTETELGIRVRISFYSWGDEQETLRKLVNSNSMDIYVYGTAFGSEELAQKGAFLDMKPYLEKVPQMVEFYQTQGVDLTKMETVYSVPQLMGSTGYGFFYREDLRQEWNLEPITDFATLECYLYKVRDAYPDVAPINDKRFFDSLLDLMMGGQYCYLDYGMGIAWEDGELVSLLDREEYQEVLKVAQKWYQDGIVSRDILYLQNNNTMTTLEMMKQDKAAVEFCNHFTAVCNNYVMALYTANPQWEFGWLDYDLQNNACYSPYIITEGHQGMAIGSTCKYPEQAVLFMEKIHTDSRYHNLLSYGVDGVHYRLSESGKISYENIPEENLFRGQVALEQEAMMLDQQYPENWDSVYTEVRERFKTMRAENKSSAIPDFSIDEDDYPEYRDVMDAYRASKVRQLLETGTAEDVLGGIDTFKEELDALDYNGFVDAVRVKWEQWRDSQGED